MHPKPECITPNTTLFDCSTKMATHKVGALPIIEPDSKKPLGIITDRDLVIMGMAKKADFNTHVSDIMTKDLLCVEPGETIEMAAKKMKEKNVRRLLVCEKNQCVGIVSLGDLACKCHGMPAEKAVLDALYELSKRSGSETSL